MMTSLSSELMNIANIQSTISEICPTYTGRGEQREYTIKQWYDHQMRCRITNQPKASQKQSWAWFKHTQYYTQWYFYEYYAQLKANKPSKLLPKKKPPTTLSLQQSIAKRLVTYYISIINGIIYSV